MSYAAGDVVWVDFLHLDTARQEGERRGDKQQCATYMVNAKNRAMLVTCAHASGGFVMLKMTSVTPPASCKHLYIELKKGSYIEIQREHWYHKNLLKKVYTKLDPDTFGAVLKEAYYQRLGGGPR